MKKLFYILLATLPLMLFPAFRAFASETQGYASTYTSIRSCTYSNDVCRNATWDGNYAPGTWHQVTGANLLEWDVHIVGSNTYSYVSSKTYYIEFTLGATGGNLAWSNMYDLMERASYTMMGSVNAGESGATSQNFTSYQCGMKEGEGTNRVIVGCYFQPKVEIKYFRVALIYQPPTFGFVEYSYYTLDHLTYEAGVEGAIQNQNILIEQGFSNVQNSISILEESINSSIEANTNAIIDANKVCSTLRITKDDIVTDNRFLNSSGTLEANGDWGVTDYYEVKNVTKLDTAGSGPSICFYDSIKTLISCSTNASVSTGLVSLPNGTVYVRFSISKVYNRPQYDIVTCKNGNQAVNDTLTDIDVDSDGNDMAEFLSSFELESEGTLSSILMLPIDFIEAVFLEDEYDDICTTFKGKQICLPSGDILWNHTATSLCDTFLGCASSANITAFRTFFNLVVGGYIGYKLLKGVAKTYDEALDPSKDMVSMMKL